MQRFSENQSNFHDRWFRYWVILFSIGRTEPAQGLFVQKTVYNEDFAQNGSLWMIKGRRPSCNYPTEQFILNGLDMTNENNRTITIWTLDSPVPRCCIRLFDAGTGEYGEIAGEFLLPAESCKSAESGKMYENTDDTEEMEDTADDAKLKDQKLQMKRRWRLHAREMYPGQRN